MSTIKIYSGETLKLECKVYDETRTAAILTGATAKFAYKLETATGEPKIKDCTITNNSLFVTLLSTETLVRGTYNYEFRVKLGVDVDSLVTGKIIIIDSLLGGLI